MKFQIRLVDKHGHGSFLYFDATLSTKEAIACKTANEYLLKKSTQDASMRGSPFYQPYKPFKTVSVVEYDNDKKGTKRGGIKFKIRLTFTEFAFTSGQKKRSEWYVAD